MDERVVQTRSKPEGSYGYLRKREGSRMQMHATASIIICEHIYAASKTVSTCPHTGFAFAPRIASDDQGEALERCEGQMRHIQPLLLPQPCQSIAYRDNDRTVPNPCFISPQTVHIRERILNLFHRALLRHFIAYHHDKKTPIHLLIAGHTMSIRSLPSR